MHLPQLLHKDSAWYWDEAQQTAFQRIKKKSESGKLTSPDILAHYNPNGRTVIAADTSSTGLGAVLQTQDNGQHCAICYISRSLSDAGRNYVVIEKEALTSTWAGECFEEYIVNWTQVYPGNRSQVTCSSPHFNRLVQDAPSNTAPSPLNDAIQPRSFARPWQMSNFN